MIIFYIVLLIIIPGFIAYDMACYIMINKIKSHVGVKLLIPGYSIYYYHKYIRNIRKRVEDEAKEAKFGR